MDGQVVIISAPSGSGKSMWLAELITKELMRGQCEHYNSDGSCFSSPLSLSALFGSADIFALEDVDIFLSGRENTQNTFAQIIVEAAHEGKKIYLTGIELQARAHHFIETVKRYCPNLKIHTSVKRSI